MADLTLRNNKGTALTFDEMDSNFLALDSDITDIKVGASQYVTLSTPQTITGSKYFNTSTSFDSVVILETLSLGGAGSQFVASSEDTVKLKFVTEYTSNTIQSGMGHISDELWLASIDSADSTGVRRIGFYLDVPDGGALDAASQSASTNARVYITLSGMTVKGLLSGDSANFSGKVTANEFHGDGSNLTGVTSYVKADFDSDFSTKSTSDLTEGTNLYYTSSRADSDAKNAISVSGSLSYDPVTGIISYTDVDSDRTVTQIRGLFSAAGDLSYDSSTGKFTNTYVDSERTVAQIRGMFNAGGDLSYDSSTGKFSFTESPTYTTSDFDSDFSTKSTSNLSEGANKYYRTVYFDSDLGDKTTDNLAEGSNLYYTTARADSDAKNAISAGGDLSYNPATGVVSYTDSERTVAQIRGMFNAGGDLSYDSALGKFSYTQITNDSVRAAFSAGGDLSYDSSTGKFSYTDSDRTPAQIRGLFSAGGDLSYNSSTGEFSYSQRTDSAIRVLISASGDLSYDAATGVMSYTDSARSADQIKALFSATGDLSFNPATGVFSYSQRTDSAVRALFNAAGDLSYDANTGVISYTDSDRSAAQIKGLFSAAGSLSYNSTTGEFSYTDSDRTASQIKGLFSASGDLSYNSTTGEFSYTDSERTVAQIRGMFNAGGDLSYDSALGKFSFTQTLYTKTNFDSDFGAKTTSDLTEGTNLYYTTARFDSDFGDNNTDQLSEGSTNLYYTTARSDSDFDVRLATKTTTNVAEGTNLYYTTARADSDAKNAVSATDAGGDGSFSYNSSTGVFTYTGPSASEARAHFSGGTGVTINSGVIAIGQPVGTTDSVTFANVISDSATIDSATINRLASTTINGQNATFDSAKVTNLSSTTLAATTSLTLGSTVAYGQDYNSISFNDNTFYGDSQNTVFSFSTKDSTDRSVSISLGVKNQFRHYFGALGTADSNETVLGYPSGNFRLLIKKNISESPVDLRGDTLFRMDSNGDIKLFSSTNSTARTNGSLVLVGGLGVGGNLRGNDIFAAGNMQVGAGKKFIGDVTGTVSSISNHTTSALAEGSNLYYTQARFDSAFGDKTTTSLSEGSNLYYTTARADSDAKNAISVNDGGGDGSLSYNPANGIISYQGPSATEVRAHLVGGTGVTYDSTTGSISIGQPVATLDSVEFANLLISGDMTIQGDFTVQGTQNITSQNDLRITNAIIKVADSNAQDTVDMGVVGRYSTDGGATIRRSGFVRDATNGEWYVFTNLVQDGLDSTTPDQTINFDDSTFELGTFNFGALRGTYLGFDSDFRVFSTNYSVTTSNITATSSQRIAADTSGGSFTVTLPASPSTGDYVKIIDVANFSTNSLIIGRNGSTIEGYADDFELDIGQSIIELIYINSTWQVYSSIGQRGETGATGPAADSANFASTNDAIAFAVALG